MGVHHKDDQSVYWDAVGGLDNDEDMTFYHDNAFHCSRWVDISLDVGGG